MTTSAAPYPEWASFIDYTLDGEDGVWNIDKLLVYGSRAVTEAYELGKKRGTEEAKNGTS